MKQWGDVEQRQWSGSASQCQDSVMLAILEEIMFFEVLWGAKGQKGTLILAAMVFFAKGWGCGGRGELDQSLKGHYGHKNENKC